MPLCRGFEKPPFPVLTKTLFLYILRIFLNANLAHPVEQHPRNVQVLSSSLRVG